jgi:hypothetical protein
VGPHHHEGTSVLHDVDRSHDPARSRGPFGDRQSAEGRVTNDARAARTDPAAGHTKETVVHKLTRRDVLRASAGAAAAAPIAALGVDAASAAPERDDFRLLDRVGHQPVMFCIHDAKRGEVSILRGRKEVVVTDRRLVSRLLRAAQQRRPVNERPASSGRRWFW